MLVPGIYYVTCQQKTVAMYRYLRYSNNCELELKIEQAKQFNSLTPELQKPYVLEMALRAS